MTLQERLDGYIKAHTDLDKMTQEGFVNLHRLAGAIASVQEQIKEEAEAAATAIEEVLPKE